MSNILGSTVTAMQAEKIKIERQKPLKRVPKIRLRSLADLDRRTTAARAAIELRNSFASDLGGESVLSSMQKAIVDNAATLGAMLENLAAGYLAGEAVNL